MTTPLPRPGADAATYLLNQAVQKSMRSSGIQLPPEFVRDEFGLNPPVARMNRGGRGGEVRLKLYLTMVLVAAQPPHQLKQQIPANVWARMLGLQDPDRLGARRVAKALAWLSANNFIDLTSRQGAPPVVKLLSAAGSGEAFARGRGVYVSVPLGLWQHGWINRMSGTGLALLVSLLDLQGGKRFTESSPPSLAGPLRRRYEPPRHVRRLTGLRRRRLPASGGERSELFRPRRV
jgi:hypothetical protein